MSRTFTHDPPGYCDACGKHCSQPFQVFIRCYWCFAGVFVPAGLFYFMECAGELHAIPLPEIEAAPSEALAVIVTDPAAAVLLERCWRFEHRFEVVPASSAAPSHAQRSV